MKYFLVAACAAVAGCAGGPPVPQQSVSTLVFDRTGLALEPPPAARETVNRLLAAPLTGETAVRIALLNNRELAARLGQVGVAAADYQIAGQIKNPAFYIDFRPPDRRPPSGTDIEASVSEDVLDILLLPLRKRIAQQVLDQSAVNGGDDVLALVHDTRVAFYTLVAHQQQLRFSEQTADSFSAAADFARRQHEAGNLNDLDFADARANEAQARMELARSKSRVATDRQALNRLMGLTGAATGWKVDMELETVPKSPTGGCDISHRLDVQSFQQAVKMAEGSVELNQRGLLNEVNVGASLEKETDHQTVIGPSIGLDVPIFNQRQGQIARAKAEAEMARMKLEAARVNAECEARSAAARMDAAREAATAADDSLVPSRVAVTAAAQKQYNGMLIGIYQLLAAKQKELAARNEAVESRLDYWIAWADFLRAEGR